MPRIHTEAKETTAPYSPIRDYAAIGDCHGSALVGRSGSVDWCCLGRFDADPVLCQLLDARRGGFLSVRPAEDFTVEREYIDGTNILRTVFTTPSGKVAVTDFMPVGRVPGAGIHDYVNLNAPHWLVRQVEGLEGRVRIEAAYRPSLDFARRPAQLTAETDRVTAAEGPTLYHDLPFEISGDTAHGAVALAAGDRRTMILASTPLAASPIDRIPSLLAITRAFWAEWISYCRYEGPYRAAVERSALILKLMTYAPSGALVAALTTSLPEEIGGVRNWDYRYCWLRDSCFTLYALAALGYGGEGRRFSHFLRVCCMETLPRVQIMYGLAAETNLRERILDHLEGYRGSRPVRTGNGAHDQRQIDVYGELLDWALLFETLGGKFDEHAKRMLEGLAEFIATHWHEPDEGLWEMRGPPRHHVHGKVMSWVAVDRVMTLLGRRPEWQELCDRIEAEILEHGVDRENGHFLQAFDRSGTDAALLLLPMLGFPLDRTRMEKTITAIERELKHGDYLKRYASEDGLEGDEGAFLICSFWLVDALLCLGRGEEARALYERLLSCANDVGLYSEEIDPGDGTFLGNFPQAFTHLALIGAATHLDLYEEGGAEAVAGRYADRAKRGAEATLGWRALWAAFKQSGRVGRIFPSRRSVLPPDLIR